MQLTHDVRNRIKRATVAIVVMNERLPTRPFEILGSGFCIHSRGVIVTCRHVIAAFMARPLELILKEHPELRGAGQGAAAVEAQSIVPYAVFFDVESQPDKVHAYMARADITVVRLTHDLGFLRVHPHVQFRSGYPTVDIAPFGAATEGTEIATCGFPLGSSLYDQIGTVTSSFTRGMVSALIPAPNASERQLTGYQLDLTATHGNSGGPVFLVETGQACGVLQGGVFDQSRRLLPGITKAEPIYPLLWDNDLERFVNAPSSVEEFIKYKEAHGPHG